MDPFFRYPHTPHLAWLSSGQPRNDKVLSSAEAKTLLDGEVIIEEKLDGANIGLSFDVDVGIRVQNRSQYLREPYYGQFSKLRNWLATHQVSLMEALRPDFIFFGEWCAARHSLDYDRLPDLFLLFDIYDRNENSFLSCSKRNDWAATAGIQTVAEFARGRFALSDLETLLAKFSSRYRAGPPEGIVIRKEYGRGAPMRAKLVRPGFLQNINEHWSRQPMQWNRIKFR